MVQRTDFQSPSNGMIHLPKHPFLEYVKGNLKRERERETTKNVVITIIYVIDRLDKAVGVPAIVAFISDSFLGMRAVRQRLIENEKGLFAYGCSSNCLRYLRMANIKSLTIFLYL